MHKESVNRFFFIKFSDSKQVSMQDRLHVESLTMDERQERRGDQLCRVNNSLLLRSWTSAAVASFLATEAPRRLLEVLFQMEDALIAANKAEERICGVRCKVLAKHVANEELPSSPLRVFFFFFLKPRLTFCQGPYGQAQ